MDILEVEDQDTESLFIALTNLTKELRNFHCDTPRALVYISTAATHWIHMHLLRTSRFLNVF